MTKELTDTPTPRTDEAAGVTGFPDAIVTANFARTLERELTALRGQLETERMKLIACGVAAMQNTEASKAERIDKTNPYWSDSYGDVCRAVDSEIMLREQLANMTQSRDHERNNVAVEQGYRKIAEEQLAEVTKDAERYRTLRNWPFAQCALVLEWPTWGPGTQYETAADVVDSRIDWYIGILIAATKEQSK